MRDPRLRAYAAVTLAAVLFPCLVTGQGPQSAIPAQSASTALAIRLENYARGEPVAPLALNELWVAAHDMRRDAAAWVLTSGAADVPRRRLVVATYFLDLLTAVESRSFWLQGQGAATMLEWACGLLREGAAQPVEGGWHLAALVLLERSAPTDVLLTHLQHAKSRFPNADRWALIEAIAEEMRAPITLNDNGTITVPGGATARVTAAYETALRFGTVLQEAQVRLGFFELRSGHPEAALARFDRVAAADDVSVRYWRHLFRGRALERLNRLDEAIEAYRLALTAVPSAQTASLALAAALAGERRMSEASAITVATITTPPTAVDPWLYYGQPDLRFWPALMSGLREAIHP
jgi:tetratricopeptide (TPR) repeat protein